MRRGLTLHLSDAYPSCHLLSLNHFALGVTRHNPGKLRLKSASWRAIVRGASYLDQRPSNTRGAEGSNTRGQIPGVRPGTLFRHSFQSELYLQREPALVLPLVAFGHDDPVAAAGNRLEDLPA